MQTWTTVLARHSKYSLGRGDIAKVVMRTALERRIWLFRCPVAILLPLLRFLLRGALRPERPAGARASA